MMGVHNFGVILHTVNALLPVFKSRNLASIGACRDLKSLGKRGNVIGVAHPTSVMVDTFGTGKISNEKLVDMIRENFDLRPAGIIKMLDLRRPIYKQTAAYGHFGRTDLDLPWEKTDKAELLKKYL